MSVAGAMGTTRRKASRTWSSTRTASRRSSRSSTAPHRTGGPQHAGLSIVPFLSHLAGGHRNKKDFPFSSMDWPCNEVGPARSAWCDVSCIGAISDYVDDHPYSH
jgi:hypothetical protein